MMLAVYIEEIPRFVQFLLNWIVYLPVMKSQVETHIKRINTATELPGLTMFMLMCDEAKTPPAVLTVSYLP